MGHCVSYSVVKNVETKLPFVPFNNTRQKALSRVALFHDTQSNDLLSNNEQFIHKSSKQPKTIQTK